MWEDGPRTKQNLINGGKAMDGCCSVAIDDFKRIAIPALHHRISNNFQAQANGMTNEDIINRLLKDIKEPDVPKFVSVCARQPLEARRTYD